MKLQLALNDFFEQSYDVTFNGNMIPKEAFRCASIDDNNYSVQDIAHCDPYPQFADHITMNVAPVIEKGLEKSRYTIHCVDAQQGEIQPHLVIRRKDFAVFNDKDTSALQVILKVIVDQNNASNRLSANKQAASTLFANKHKVESALEVTAPSQHYQLRHH